ncbi:hypothetical protein [Sedimentitalea sp.]|uniref:hypothetical protein n=1 Tax=Sedimentitalea sp. TaxID=2048915 RepID=UPI00329A690F
MLRLALADNENAIQLRASAKKGWDADAPAELPPEAEHLPNAVASCALMLAVAFNRKPDDKTNDAPPDKEFKELMDPLMECGLDQVSPECKERLLVARADVAVRDIATGDKDAVEKSLAAIDQCIDEMPYLEGVSDILDSDELFAQVNDKKVDKTILRRIADKAMGRLDIASQMKLLSAILGKAKNVKGAQDVGNAAARPMIKDLAKYNDIYRDELRAKFGTKKPRDVGEDKEVRVPKRDAPRKIEGLLDATEAKDTVGRGFPGMSFEEGLKTFSEATKLLRKHKIKNDLH